MNQNLLEMDWETDLNALTAKDAWTFFSSMLNDQMRKYIPKSAPSKDKRRKLWMTRKVIAQHKKNRQVWTRLDIVWTTSEQLLRKLNSVP